MSHDTTDYSTSGPMQDLHSTSYSTQCQQLIQSLIQLNISTQWNYITTQNTIDIYHRPQISNNTQCAAFKGIGIVNTNIRAVLDFLTDTKKKTSYDELFSDYKSIESVDETTRIEQWRYWVCMAA